MRDTLWAAYPGGESTDILFSATLADGRPFQLRWSIKQRDILMGHAPWLLSQMADQVLHLKGQFGE